jgi:hypothetical protein
VFDRAVARKMLALDLLCGTFLLVYGGFSHRFLFKYYVSQNYPAGSNRSVVDHPLRAGIITVLGGISVAAVMLRLFHRYLRQGPRAISVKLGTAALYGALASLLAVEALYILLSLWLFVKAFEEPYHAGPLSLLFAFIEIQTYGMSLVVLCVPFGVLIGGVAGLVLLVLQRLVSPETAG